MSYFNDIVWNGVSLETASGGKAHIEHFPPIPAPERKIDVESVPGRNGDIIIVQDAWNNVEQEFEIVFGGVETKYEAQTVAKLIGGWLFGPSGYQKLSSTYDPDYYRLAYFKGPYDIENILNYYGRGTITFNCRPEKFLTSGESWIDLSTDNANPTILANPTQFPSKPLIELRASSTAYVTIQNSSGSSTVTINNLNGIANIDCENMTVYNSVGTSLNSQTIITSNKPFPVLMPGTNTIIVHNGTSAKIKPHWWTI